MYITRSLRESCKILIKGFNKEFPPGSLAEHPQQQGSEHAQ